MNAARQPAANVAARLPMSAWADGRFARVLYLFDRLLEKLTWGKVRLRIYIFCAQPIGSGAYASVRDDPHTRVTQVTEESALTADYPRRADVVRERIRRGSTFYVATVREEFAGCIWIAKSIYSEDEVRAKYILPTDNKCVWDFDVFVAPRFRLGRTLGRLWKGVDAALEHGGVQWSFSRISLFNASSIRTHERLGAVFQSTGVFLTLGPFQLSLCTQTPFVHLSLGPAYRPCLSLIAPSGPR